MTFRGLPARQSECPHNRSGLPARQAWLTDDLRELPARQSNSSPARSGVRARARAGEVPLVRLHDEGLRLLATSGRVEVSVTERSGVSMFSAKKNSPWQRGSRRSPTRVRSGQREFPDAFRGLRRSITRRSYAVKVKIPDACFCLRGLERRCVTARAQRRREHKNQVVRGRLPIVIST